MARIAMTVNIGDNQVNSLHATNSLPAGSNSLPATGGEFNANENTDALLVTATKGYGEVAGSSATEAIHLRRRLLGY